MRNEADKVAQCTSAQFDGIIAVMREGSWVARWQRTGSLTLLLLSLPPPNFCLLCGLAFELTEVLGGLASFHFDMWRWCRQLREGTVCGEGDGSIARGCSG